MEYGGFLQGIGNPTNACCRHVFLYFCAMLLRNAYVTMNSGITQHYFDCDPPTLEEWLERGPVP